MKTAEFADRVGLGWRAELAQQICDNVDHSGDIEFVEVIAEAYFKSPMRDLRALSAFAQDVPLSLHGVTLGLATQGPLDTKIVDQMARLCEVVRPAFWSEHLSFVRANGREIGHMAAPPWTLATAEAAIKNAERAAQIVGQAPALENISTLIYPPCSSMTEIEWLNTIAANSQGGLLLDLNNLYVNSVNCGFDYMEALRWLPLHRVRQIHVSGGVEIPAPGKATRILDDHSHDVVGPCYQLLEEVGALAQQPLTVVIERDGRYPPFVTLLEQVRKIKVALKAGRDRLRVASVPLQADIVYQ